MFLSEYFLFYQHRIRLFTVRVLKYFKGSKKYHIFTRRMSYYYKIENHLNINALHVAYLLLRMSHMQTLYVYSYTF